jgi:hypothetical protein
VNLKSNITQQCLTGVQIPANVTSIECDWMDFTWAIQKVTSGELLITKQAIRKNYSMQKKHAYN